MYDESTARRLAEERGWTIAPDGEGWRRVVASPIPRSVVELSTVKLLLEHGVIVVCAGGGGVPIVIDNDGARHGVEAVVDKDATTAMLARDLGADLLLLLTDVPAVQSGWGTAEAQPIETTTDRALLALEFAAGSMGPKVAAAASFVGKTGARAAIGALGDAAALVRGEGGTQVTSAATAAACGAGRTAGL